jgi:quercetin dioxygenase-like cupin family protein
MPPDSEWDYAGGYAGSLAEAGAAESHVDSDEMAGLHQTDSVDIITIISGEMYAVLETTETLLKPGDTFVQRGTRHAWSNRTDQPCVYVSIMVGATR